MRDGQLARRVAIIGAGPAGLAALKSAREEGLEAVAFEAKDRPGGLWTEPGLVWNSLRTNLSRYSCVFSDHPHDRTTPLFPEGRRVAAYLAGYAARFGLDEAIRPGHRVMAVIPRTPGFRLMVEADGRIETHDTDAVIVASGVFAEALMPQGLTIGGAVMHAAAYRDPAVFAGKRVAVLGSAFSGADIAAEIAGVAERTVMLMRRPAWYVPRAVPVLPEAGFMPADAGDDRIRLRLPMDLVINSRARAQRLAALDGATAGRERWSWLDGIAGDQRRLHPLLDVPEDDLAAPMVISDALPAAVRSGRLELARAVDFDPARLTLQEGGRESRFDVLICATGYRPSLAMLAPGILEAIGYDPHDRLQPVLLGHCVFPEGVPDLAFVGMYRGPYFGVMELQARWAAAVLAGKLPRPDPLDLEHAVAAERAIRDVRPRPQFPHADYPAMCDALAEKLGVMPDLLHDGTGLGRFLWHGPVLPAQYRLSGRHARPDIALGTLAEVAVLFGQDAFGQGGLGQEGFSQQQED